MLALIVVGFGGRNRIVAAHVNVRGVNLHKCIYYRNLWAHRTLPGSIWAGKRAPRTLPGSTWARAGIRAVSLLPVHLVFGSPNTLPDLVSVKIRNPLLTLPSIIQVDCCMACPI